jgi:hypothetical protein
MNMEDSKLATFDREIKTITDRRGEVYGHPAKDFSIAADLMRHFDHVEPPALRHALRMVCVKLARLTTTPTHLDSYIDIAGYVRTAVMVMDAAPTPEARVNTAKFLDDLLSPQRFDPPIGAGWPVPPTPVSGNVALSAREEALEDMVEFARTGGYPVKP